jgi:hypothetical protein
VFPKENLAFLDDPTNGVGCTWANVPPYVTSQSALITIRAGYLSTSPIFQVLIGGGFVIVEVSRSRAIDFVICAYIFQRQIISAF